MQLKRKLATGLAAFALGVGVSLGVATPASASVTLTSGDFTEACQTQYGSDGWQAHLYDSGSVYGWKCFYFDGWVWSPWTSERRDLNLNAYCNQVYGTYAGFTNSSNPYSWYCV